MKISVKFLSSFASLLILREISGFRFGIAIVAGELTFETRACTFLAGRTLSRYRASGAYESTARRVECERVQQRDARNAWNATGPRRPSVITTAQCRRIPSGSELPFFATRRHSSLRLESRAKFGTSMAREVGSMRCIVHGRYLIREITNVALNWPSRV